MSDLQVLVENGPSWASHSASKALKYKQAHESGEISDSELNELLEDLMRLDEIEGRADNMVMKANLIRGIKALMIFV